MESRINKVAREYRSLGVRCKSCKGNVKIEYTDTKEILAKPSKNNRGLEKITRKIESAYCLSCEDHGSVHNVIELLRLYLPPDPSLLLFSFRWGDVTKYRSRTVSDSHGKLGDTLDMFYCEYDFSHSVERSMTGSLQIFSPRIKSVRKILNTPKMSYEWVKGEKVKEDYRTIMTSIPDE